MDNHNMQRCGDEPLRKRRMTRVQPNGARHVRKSGPGKGQGSIPKARVVFLN